MERLELARHLGPTVGTAGPSVTVVSASDPMVFMTEFRRAVAGGGAVLLADPRWGRREREELAALRNRLASGVEGPGDVGWLGVPTGGTGGRVRFARHDGTTLAAAVAGFARHFGVERVHAGGVLPLHHVSGLMAWLRSALTGGDFQAWDWRRIEAGDLPPLPPRSEGWFFSVVPTQLARLLARPAAVEWLRGFRAVLVGGAGADAGLLERAAAARLPLAPSYGMTETAAMVAALRPEEFLRGRRDVGTALPHARVEVSTDGGVWVGGESVFRGYFPDGRPEGPFATEDLGRMAADGYLEIFGRRDQVLITGGEKVAPGEVEVVLRRATGVARLAVVGVPDAEWGQRVVAVVGPGEIFSAEQAQAAARRELAPAQRPKAYLVVTEWPENAAGKVNRARLVALARRALG